MQARLILLALKIGTSEPENCAVVPPDEATDGGLEHVCYGDKGPEPVPTVYVLWCESGQCCNGVIFCTSEVVDGNQNTAADSGEDQKDVA